MLRHQRPHRRKVGKQRPSHVPACAIAPWAPPVQRPAQGKLEPALQRPRRRKVGKQRPSTAPALRAAPPPPAQQPPAKQGGGSSLGAKQLGELLRSMRDVVFASACPNKIRSNLRGLARGRSMSCRGWDSDGRGTQRALKLRSKEAAASAVSHWTHSPPLSDGVGPGFAFSAPALDAAASGLAKNGSAGFELDAAFVCAAGNPEDAKDKHRRIFAIVLQSERPEVNGAGIFEPLEESSCPRAARVNVLLASVRSAQLEPKSDGIDRAAAAPTAASYAAEALPEPAVFEVIEAASDERAAGALGQREAAAARVVGCLADVGSEALSIVRFPGAAVRGPSAQQSAEASSEINAADVFGLVAEASAGPGRAQPGPKGGLASHRSAPHAVQRGARRDRGCSWAAAALLPPEKKVLPWIAEAHEGDMAPASSQISVGFLESGFSLLAALPSLRRDS
ncbi:unnamed protein product [Prorocentrum cordatum]|uniref:Uncharacterized protein n=1 Tax=Prorocentrum cordatum TaxID=2364126 RepID=A0ABN9ULC1_9DINO|nr:unnamed protein product [Polarella glacialis]